MLFIMMVHVGLLVEKKEAEWVYSGREGASSRHGLAAPAPAMFHGVKILPREGVKETGCYIQTPTPASGERGAAKTDGVLHPDSYTGQWRERGS